MSVTAELLAQLRRCICEATSDVYTDAVLTALLEEYPLPDAVGRVSGHSGWTPRYDVNAAASAVWGEKAAALTQAFDVDADGSDLKRSQMHAQALKQARYFAARRAVTHIAHVQAPLDDGSLERMRLLQERFTAGAVYE